MRCPTIKELPPPPPDKTGWPWTEESPQLPDAMPDGSPWPKISIITPSFNQGLFIEETIRSVLLQGYSDLEYIVIDGGSKDGSIEIISKYEKWLTYWVSEPDKGQTDAINKGFRKANGELLVWLNSDDVYIADALKTIGRAYKETPDKIIAGNCIHYKDGTGEKFLIEQSNLSLKYFILFWEGMGDSDSVNSHAVHAVWSQPGLFFPSSLIYKIGMLDTSLRYSMDYDFLCRALKNYEVSYESKPIAIFRIHKDAKTTANYFDSIVEATSVYMRYRLLVDDLKKSDIRLARFLIRTASYQLRSFNWKIAKNLFYSAWRNLPRFTIVEIIREFVRLLFGGRYTGRT